MVLLVPIGIAHATITGSMGLGYTNAGMTTYTSATKNISVVAGSETVTNKCDTPNTCIAVSPPNNVFSVSFNSVTFAASQFYLYMSKNGFANINTTLGDVRYAGPFNVADLSSATLVPYTFSGITYYVGTVAGTQVVVGSIPIDISNAFKYIKAYDGSCGVGSSVVCGGTSMAASLPTVAVQPGLQVTPTSGAAGTPVSYLGGGFPASTNIVIAYSFTFYSWSGSSSVKTGNATVAFSTGPGYFTVPGTMVDTKQSVGGSGGPHPTTVITLNAILSAAPHTFYASTSFTEYNRGFSEIVTSDQSGVPTDYTNSFVSGDLYANDTAATCTGNILCLGEQPSGIMTYVNGTIVIAGNYTVISSPVTFWIGSLEIGSTASNSIGTFNGTAFVPAVANGPHIVTVMFGDSIYYSFYIYVLPTLVLNVTQGTASNPTTSVRAYAYGFGSNSTFLLYWYQYSWNDQLWYNVVNGTTGSNGQFNETVTFTVPETYGGTHQITVLNLATQDVVGEGGDGGTTLSVIPNSVTGSCTSESSPSMCEENYDDGVLVANATFTVLPSLVVVPHSFNDTGQTVTAIAEGLNPLAWYSVNIDNQMADFSTVNVGGGVGVQLINTCTTTTSMFGHHTHIYCSTHLVNYSNAPVGVHGLVVPSGVGNLTLTFIGAGFQPGLHEVSLTSMPEGAYTSTSHSYGPDVWALFTVGLGGDAAFSALSSQLSALSTTMNSLSTTITSIDNSLSVISSSISSLTSSVSTIQADVTSIQSSITTLTSTVNDIQSTVNAINTWTSSVTTSLATITTDIGTVQSGITSMESTLATMGSAITSIQSSVSGISGVGSNVSSTLSAVQAEQTYVLVVAVLAAITLVLVLAVLVRKLS